MVVVSRKGDNQGAGGSFLVIEHGSYASVGLLIII